VLGEAVRRDACERAAKLTPREMEVATALAEGLSNKLVAHRLGISVRTAEMHRARILRKLSLRSVAEIVPLLAQAGAEPDGRLQLLAQRRLRGLSDARSAA
jgi:DNA-binding CsgD family transcriptional regulator